MTEDTYYADRSAAPVATGVADPMPEHNAVYACHRGCGFIATVLAGVEGAVLKIRHQLALDCPICGQAIGFHHYEDVNTGEQCNRSGQPINPETGVTLETEKLQADEAKANEQGSGQTPEQQQAAATESENYHDNTVVNPSAPTTNQLESDKSLSPSSTEQASPVTDNGITTPTVAGPVPAPGTPAVEPEHVNSTSVGESDSASGVAALPDPAPPTNSTSHVETPSV